MIPDINRHQRLWLLSYLSLPFLFTGDTFYLLWIYAATAVLQLYSLQDWPCNKVFDMLNMFCCCLHRPWVPHIAPLWPQIARTTFMGRLHLSEHTYSWGTAWDQRIGGTSLRNSKRKSKFLGKILQWNTKWNCKMSKKLKDVFLL